MVSIIIPTYQHLEDLLKPCLKSIIEYTAMDLVEVIVVANGCTDGTQEYVKSLGNPFKLIDVEEQLGYTKAVNLGLKICGDSDAVLLLNNDTILLQQPKHGWINILLHKMQEDPRNGVVSVTVKTSEATERKFGIFFCAMIRKETLAEVGLLDEVFSPGYGEDIDFCHRAEDKGWKIVAAIGGEDTQKYETAFPIYHVGSVSVVADLDDYDSVVTRNDGILRHRYVITPLETLYERFVAGSMDEIPPREAARYKWAREQLKGKKVLDIGCSSGYGSRFFEDVEDLDYTGLDYNEAIIEFANKNYASDRVRFVHGSVLDFDFEQYDLIIAFELLEHIDEGREVAQKLKNHAKTFVCSCPYNEPTVEEIHAGDPGTNWGIHHKLHRLTEVDFPGFEHYYIDPVGNINHVRHNAPFYLMLMRHEKHQDNSNGRVTAMISTKDRYYTTLPACILSVANQSVLPDELIIYDDGEQLDLRDIPVYRNIFAILERKNISWAIRFGKRIGQVANHIDILTTTDSEYIWRIDDDNFVEYDVLENLLGVMNSVDKVGAVAGLSTQPEVFVNREDASSLIGDLYSKSNLQWSEFKDSEDVDHLHNTFLFRRALGIGLHNTDLSAVGHREETLFTYKIKKLGYRVIVCGDVRTWHLREPSGGIRSYTEAQHYEHDEAIFNAEMAKLGASTAGKTFTVALDSGIGDHYAFKHILKDLIEKHGNVTLAVCYADVFVDFPEVEIISLDSARKLGVDVKAHNIYKWMAENNWKGTIVEAFRRMYDV